MRLGREHRSEPSRVSPGSAPLWKELSCGSRAAVTVLSLTPRGRRRTSGRVDAFSTVVMNETRPQAKRLNRGLEPEVAARNAAALADSLARAGSGGSLAAGSESDATPSPSPNSAGPGPGRLGLGVQVG